MSTCSNNELLRDYAFDEIPVAERPAFERHLATCAECAGELDRLQMTTSALRILPDREPPQRIAFVSDKVYKQSRMWNLAPWFGFASAGVMAVALIADVSHRPAAEIRTVAVQTQPPAAAPIQPVNEIVQRAVSEAQAEDARIFQAALAELERKHLQEHLNLMDAINVLDAHQKTRAIEEATQ